MAENLQLTDFLDVQTLQEIQDQFAAVTGVRTSIRNAAGEPLTRLTPLGGAPLLEAGASGGAYSAAAPIELGGQRLGAIVVEDRVRPVHDAARMADLAARLGVSTEQLARLADELDPQQVQRHDAVLDFMRLLANAMARMCFQEYQLRRRVEELSTIYRVARELVGRNDLPQVLDLITRTVVDVMKIKAASLRLLDPDRRELLVKSVCNLSPGYLNKGPVLVDASRIDRAALAGEIVYVGDLAHDLRVLYPAEMAREGLVSALVVGLHYRGRPIGVMRAYTADRHDFSAFEISLLRAIANQAAAAIVNTELQAEKRRAELTQQQINLARDVQRRMIPSAPPCLERFEIAALYTPCFELGGDFYDFLELPDGRWGLVIADVVGKGVAASLMMASVRASLRAYALQCRRIDELLGRVNRALCRDTLPNEFVTMFYAELAPAARRLTYCNAGHNPPILLSGGRFRELSEGGTVVGAFEDARYPVAEADLRPGDLLLLYTDGLVDSLNFKEERYDLGRVRENLARFADQPPRQILGNIRWEVRKFTGLTPRVDDLTMVAIKAL